MTHTKPQIAALVRQIDINPGAAEGEDGTHVGWCLVSLFTETCWPSRTAETN
jgi:hypothetical protein